MSTQSCSNKNQGIRGIFFIDFVGFLYSVIINERNHNKKIGRILSKYFFIFDIFHLKIKFELCFGHIIIDLDEIFLTILNRVKIHIFILH